VRDRPDEQPQAQPDCSEPSLERQAELRAEYEANVVAGKAPYVGVYFDTLDELRWVMQERRWSGDHELPPGYERADLSGANFNSADLDNARLQGANLSGASLMQAYLDGADLRGANVREANFSMASMRHVTLAGADLRGAQVADVRMVGADLRDVHLDRDATTQLVSACIAFGPRKLPRIDWSVLPLATVEWGEVFDLAEQRIATLQYMHTEGLPVFLPSDENGEPVLGEPEQELVKAYQTLARSYQHLAAVWHAHGLDAPANRLRHRAGVMHNEWVRRHADSDAQEKADHAERDEDALF
jgi:hypothetical protein